MYAEPVMLCARCAFIIANGEDGDYPDTAEHGEVMAEHMARLPGGWCVSGEAFVGSDPCDACGTVLLGDRVEGAVLTVVPVEAHPVRLDAWTDDPEQSPVLSVDA